MTTASVDGFQKVEQLWFSTDAVVLRAQTRIFRVFVALLKEKSSVFADMFAFPQPSSSDMETMEGIPVVTLHDDPAELEVFLKAIFDSEFFMPPPVQSKFEDTLGILRLAHKYDVPYLRRRALEHLGSIYPTSLSEYDSRPDILNAQQLSEDNFGRRFVTIQAATEVDALWLLPVAYYDICKAGLSRIIKDARWLDLGDEARTTVLLGYSAQAQQCPKVLNFLFIGKGGNDCEKWTSCNKARLEMGRLTNTNLGRGRRAISPLDVWREPVWAAAEQMFKPLCSNCITEAKALQAVARNQCWDELPKMFGLPGWEELEEMRRLALST